MANKKMPVLLLDDGFSTIGYEKAPFSKVQAQKELARLEQFIAFYKRAIELCTYSTAQLAYVDDATTKRFLKTAAEARRRWYAWSANLDEPLTHCIFFEAIAEARARGAEFQRFIQQAIGEQR